MKLSSSCSAESALISAKQSKNIVHLIVCIIIFESEMLFTPSHFLCPHLTTLFCLYIFYSHLFVLLCIYIFFCHSFLSSLLSVSSVLWDLLCCERVDSWIQAFINIVYWAKINNPINITFCTWNRLILFACYCFAELSQQRLDYHELHELNYIWGLKGKVWTERCWLKLNTSNRICGSIFGHWEVNSHNDDSEVADF